MVLNSTSFQLDWSPPPAEHRNGEITEYRVNVTEQRTGRILSFGSPVTQLNVAGLHPYFLYKCIVLAITVAEGPFSDPLVIQTDQAGKGVQLTPE